jgi:hypothetical protein
MMDMTRLRYRNGNQHLHHRSADYRNHVRRKMRAYHVFIQAGVVAQGLLQYPAILKVSNLQDSQIIRKLIHGGDGAFAVPSFRAASRLCRLSGSPAGARRQYRDG